MALYEFRCTNEECAKEFEARVAIKELDITVVMCPDCNTKADRQISKLSTAHTTWKNWRL